MKSKRQIVKLEKLYEHPNNPRKQFDVSELVESITDLGLLSPLLVRVWGDGFQIISGHRRKAALVQIGLASVNCDVVELDDEQAFRALMVANIQSNSLSELEEAEGIKQMIDQFKWSQDRVSKEFGKSQIWVNRRLDLLGLDNQIQEKIITRVITATHGREIAQAPKEMQSAIADKVVKEDLTTRETEQLVKVLKDESISPELKQRAIETTTPPAEIQKQSLKEDVRQAVQEARHEIIDQHADPGTSPPAKTDAEIKAEKRELVLDGLFIALRDAAALLQPDPKMFPLLVEFKRTSEAMNHLGFMVELIENLKKGIAEAKKQAAKQPVNLSAGKVLEFKK